MKGSTRELWHSGVHQQNDLGFRALYERFNRLIHFLADVRFSDSRAYSSADLVQDVWRTILRSQPMVHDTLHAKRLLRKIVCQKALHAVNRSCRQLELEQAAESSQSTVDEVSNSDLFEAIEAKLGREARRVAGLVAADMSEREIAALEGVTVHHIRRIKSSLKAVFTSWSD